VRVVRGLAHREQSETCKGFGSHGLSEQGAE